MTEPTRGVAGLASGIFILVTTLSSITAPDATAQGSTVKYVYTIDYPLAQKGAYLDWVQSVADALQAPVEVKRIASYDNYFGGSPHRFIEFEFDNLEAAGRYYDRPEVKEVLEDVVNRGINASMSVLQLRGDYTARGGNTAQPGAIKYVFAVDYPLAQKAAYLEWVRSVVDALEAPEEVRRITSYDNYFGVSPHRFIEFEFDNLETAARYHERPDVTRVLEDVVNHGINARVWVLKLRGDYSKR